MTDKGHIPITSQVLATLPLNVLMTLCGCCKCSAEERGARFRTMASPILEPPPSSEVGVLAVVSFALLWLLFPEIKDCTQVKQQVRIQLILQKTTRSVHNTMDIPIQASHKVIYCRTVQPAHGLCGQGEQEGQVLLHQLLYTVADSIHLSHLADLTVLKSDSSLYLL